MYSPAFEEIKDRCVLCEKCPLHENRQHTLFGSGNERARVLFVVDSPQEKDDLRGSLFSSESGKILDNVLTLADLDRSKDLFITSIVKCPTKDGTPPTRAQMDECMPLLREQVRHIKPNIIVCLGETATRKMIDEYVYVSRIHGRFYKKGKLFFMATHSPYELADDLEMRLTFFEDMKLLGKAIREGQLQGQ